MNTDDLPESQKVKLRFLKDEYLVDDPDNITIYGSEYEIDNLAEVMKEYGFQGVILAYPIEGGKYRIESGHRRRLAARKAGIETIPVLETVPPKTEYERKRRLFGANLLERDKNPIITARVADNLYYTFRDEYEYKKENDLLDKDEDGNLIECVLMKYKHGNSICISTQVGCRMGCKFCASTLGGRIRNLTAGEILSEIMVAQDYLGERVSNIVLMGSGEPLDNYDNVVKFLELVNAEYGLNIGQRHITLSTCGIVPKIYELADLELSVTLAISLHAFSDEKRREIMPIAKKYSISEILEACEYYINKTGRRITFEYSLVAGVNDGKEDAKSLSKLVKGMLCHVNLIPVNEIKENTLKRPSKKNILEFEEILKDNGIEVTVRREMGTDINAACGQLRRSYLEENR